MQSVQHTQSSSVPGEGLILAAAVLWGTTGTAQALAPAGATPASVGAIRLVLGGIALLLFALGQGSLRRTGWPLLPTAAGAVSMAAYQLCFFAGVARTGVAVGTVVAIGSGPVIAGVLGVLLLGERPTMRWLGATILAVTGCAVLTLAGGGGTTSVDPVGVALAVGAGASYAVYTIASKTLLRVQPPAAVAGLVFFGGALLLLPVLFFVDLTWMLDLRGMAVALHLGLVATALAYVLYVSGLQTVPVASAVTLALAEPMTAALLGVLLLGESLPAPALAGIGLLLGGLILLTARRSPSDR